MTDRDEPRVPGGPEQGGADPERAPTTNLAAVAGAIVLIGLAAFALYHRSRPREAGGEPPAGAEATPVPGTPVSAVVPIRLSPEASIIAERYRCVCGCNDLLNVCTCNKTPGSNDMKRFLQSLADQKRTAAEIDAAMVAKYGPGVILANTPPGSVARPGTTPAPSSQRPAASRRPSDRS